MLNTDIYISQSIGSPPFPDEDLTSTDIAVYVSAAFAALMLLCILLCVCSPVYYSCVKEGKTLCSFLSDDNLYRA